MGNYGANQQPEDQQQPQLDHVDRLYDIRWTGYIEAMQKYCRISHDWQHRHQADDRYT